LCSVVVLCRSLKLYRKETTTENARFFAPFSSRARTLAILSHQYSESHANSHIFFLLLLHTQQTRRKKPRDQKKGGKRGKIQFLLVATKERILGVKILEEIISFSNFFSSCVRTKKNHSLKTQWLVLNKPLVNPPVRFCFVQIICIRSFVLLFLVVVVNCC